MRNPRRQGESNVYHIIARGTGKQLIFEDDQDRIKFLSFMSQACRESHVELYAWCLMGNHFHLLASAPIEDISSFIKKLCGWYARYFNDRHGRTGHLFQERFRSEPVESDEYLMTVVRYIHRNPDNSGIGRYDTYPWSSYSEYIGTERYCSTDFVLSLFGTIHVFIAMHALDVEENGCMELGCRLRPSNPMDDEAALAIARRTLGDIPVSDVKIFERGRRDALLRKLKDSGLSIRHIERITGISRSVIGRA